MTGLPTAPSRQLATRAARKKHRTRRLLKRALFSAPFLYPAAATLMCIGQRQVIYSL